jgi:Zn-dependent protease
MMNTFINNSSIQALKMKISHEFKDIVKAWLAISIAFGILIYAEKKPFVFSIAVAAITVGLGFLCHELSHRYYARKFGKHAEFKANNMMLILAIVMSFLGFIIAAPGAVVISGFVTRKEGGIIATAGPAANLVLALLFLPFVFIFSHGSIPAFIAYIGLMINAWLALFNLIPFPGFDGHKIVEWSKPAYFIMLGIAIVINVIQVILPNIMHI